MANYFFCLCVVKIALPLLLSACVIFRPCALSAIYLIMFFYLPMVPVPTLTTMAGHTGIYLKILIAVSVLTTLAQLSFQIVLLAMPPYGAFLENCSMLERILRHVGFVKMNSMSGLAITTWLTPEIIMLLSSIIIYFSCNKVINIQDPTLRGDSSAATPILESSRKNKFLRIAVTVGKYITLVSLCVAAILRPSIPGGFYFLVFLSCTTWWAMNNSLERGFAITLRVVMVVVVVHICCLYAYQTQWPQEFLNSTSPYPRYFGLTPLMTVKCSDPRDFIWEHVEWASYLNPLALLWLYYILAVESKALLESKRNKVQQKLGKFMKRRSESLSKHMVQFSFEKHKKPGKKAHNRRRTQKKQGAFSRLEGSINGPLNRQKSQRLSNRRLVRSRTTRHRWQSATRKVRVKKQAGKPSEKTPLIRGVSPSAKYSGSNRKPGPILQDSTGSVTVSGDGQDDIPLEELEDEKEENPTLLDNIIFGIIAVIHVAIRSSYIATNIMMMAWSITFHSWITFILLLWANVLWMVPNQRQAMLRCTPPLVAYSILLLIAGYIFSMNLTDDELPQKIGDVNLGPIGFPKVTELPCRDLLVKCLFTCMFWISMKQYMKEREEAKQSSTLADMMAPLQVTVGTAAGVSREEDKGTKMMHLFGQHLKGFLTKFWIWIVAITLFAVAITGKRMTGFRIIYMALFLSFILCFQLSFRLWRKLMFGFWVTVILYSMINLCLVYTYQFKNIQRYWLEYLHITKTQQLDIGLEVFPPRQLFVRLVTPTFFVIITVIQLQYFHKDFMELSSPKRRASVVEPLSEGSSAQGGVLEHSSEKTDFESSTKSKIDLSDIGNISKMQLQEAVQSWMKKAHHVLNLSYLFLEIHMPKIVLILAVLLSIFDKCAIYVIVVILIVIACTMGRPVYIFSMYSTSVLTSLMILARMIYQIEYIEHGIWNVTCDTSIFENETGNTTILNTAEWLGFKKTSDTITLPMLVKWNIIFVLAITLWSVIMVRQKNYRISLGRPIKRPYFMFPRIKRSDADMNIKNCIKYLLNFGYYKFGLEICLMCIVTTIGVRMDIYAICYAIWLCIILSVKRKTVAKFWNVLFMFIAVALPVQYIMLVGLPPTLCQVFPWDANEILQSLQQWLFILDFKHPLPAQKLICDFLLLLLVSRQALIFRIEKRHVGQEYPGGSNESIIHHAEEKGFVNPVPDYITYCRTYLDIVKRAIFLSFLWITLAIVFLAGTNRVSIFSGGYLIGAFIFLWQGTDLYLRPIPKILKSWGFLLGYNVAVILIKSILQIAGCIYIEELKENACWFVQIMSIGCVKKFSHVTARLPVKDLDTCNVPREYIGLVWDGLCFGFLLMQLRLFKSYYFFHLINETKAITILASRGADLLEELKARKMREQAESERRILEKIKAKMDKIKANQQKLHGPSFKDSTNHYVAIRSGDYYMFDDDEDEVELDLIEETPSTEDLEDEKERQDSLLRQPTLGELVSSTMKSGLGTTLRSSSLEIRRRSSMPIFRQRSTRSQLSVPLSAPPTVGGQQHTVVIIDPKGRKDQTDREPQPGTSKDEELSELSAPREDSTCQKILYYLLFVLAFISSSMVSLTLFLNKYSREFRYVLRVLSKEKKHLKEKTSYSVGIRLGRAQKWQPGGSYHTLLKESRRQDSPTNLLDEYEGGEISSVDQPPSIRLLLAIWYIILSHSDILCYFMIFLNQIKSATFLSLPLPFMVFFWGTLSIPRPSKTFWITVIAYTEIIVLVKCIFQFEILPWNRSENISPFFPPRIMGIEKRSGYALWDLLVLLIVFFHRFLLKSLGLWKSTYMPAVILADGEYKITKGELQHMDDDSSEMPSSVTAGGSGTLQPVKTIHGRNASDLQRLVEESEESAESERRGDTQSSASEDQIVSIQTEQVHPCSQFGIALRLGMFRYADSMKIFFLQLIDPASRVATDVYSYMFLCDFFNFFVILMGFTSFGPSQGDEGVSSYLEENRVPVLFLVMLILQFALIIVDRAIFLRKFIVGKIVFQYIQIVVLHIWLFIVFPLITERGFNSVLPPQIYYMVKCFYLLLSAYQIRSGYPTRILGNFLCKGYGYVNMFLFKAFMAVPFLFELRTVMDWMWTDTSMTVFDWIKMEDIFAHIFQLKCVRYVESEYPQARGEKRTPIMKYLMGGAALVVMIAIIWFPLVFFSLGNAVGKSNVPYDVTVDLRIGPYQPIYQMSVQSNNIFSFNDTDMGRLYKAYDQNKVALTYINNFEGGDIAAIKFSKDSSSVWTISPPDRERMLVEVASDSPLTVHFQYQVSHKSNTKEDSGIIREENSFSIPAKVGGKPNPVRQNLLKMLNGTADVPPVPLLYTFPKFIKVTNKGTAKPISQLLDKFDKAGRDTTLRNITIRHESSNGTQTNPRKEWWEITEDCDDDNYKRYLRHLPYADCSYILMYTFNDKIFPSTLNFITGGGIIGVYTTLVLVAGRLLRGFFAGMCFKIMFEDLPNVDRVLQLCFDIYLVREAREFFLEEDLFAKVVFLFRSPETLIKWTRPVEEANEEDEEEGEEDENRAQ